MLQETNTVLQRGGVGKEFPLLIDYDDDEIRHDKNKLWLRLVPAGIPVDDTSFMPTTDAEDVSWRLRQLKSSRALLRRVLEPGEQLRFISEGNMLSPLELALFAFPWVWMNASMVVLTDRRIIFIRMGGDQRPANFVSHIPLRAIQEIRVNRFSGMMRFKVGSENYALRGMPRKDLKHLRSLISIRPSGDAEFERLCPSCLVATEFEDNACVRCGAEIKDSRRAVVRASLIPGAGQYYLGYRCLGLVQGFLSIAFLIFFWSLLFVQFKAYPVNWWMVAVGALGVLLVHAISALTTREQAFKGHHSWDGALPSLGSVGTGRRISVTGQLVSPEVSGPWYRRLWMAVTSASKS